MKPDAASDRSSPPESPASLKSPASPALELVSALVRAWTHVYTWRVEPRIRDVRRAEIASDLWEFQQDPERGKHPAAHVLARLLIGMPDDLLWRAEHTAARDTHARPLLRFVVWTLATVIVAAAIFILPLMTTDTLPPLPDKPRVVIKAPPPPPPPPPPPCAPAGFPQSSRPCTP